MSVQCSIDDKIAYAYVESAKKLWVYADPKADFFAQQSPGFLLYEGDLFLLERRCADELASFRDACMLSSRSLQVGT